MSKKVFVGGLSWNTTDETLGAAFGAYGDVVEARVVTERGTGRSRGFGFVTFGNDEAVQKAVADMNGKELDGRRIRVDEAKESSRDDHGGERRAPRPRRDEDE